MNNRKDKNLATFEVREKNVRALKMMNRGTHLDGAHCILCVSVSLTRILHMIIHAMVLRWLESDLCNESSQANKLESSQLNHSS